MTTKRSIIQPTYGDTTTTSQEECPLQCSLQANHARQAGCCEYRVSDSTCVWTAALDYPYLAYERRTFDTDDGLPGFMPNLSGSFQNTKSVLCSSGITWEGILLIEYN